MKIQVAGCLILAVLAMGCQNPTSGSSSSSSSSSGGSSGGSTSGLTGPSYSVTYNINGATGTTPVDSNKYQAYQSFTVPGQGNLSRPGYIFLGWYLGNANPTDLFPGSVTPPEVAPVS